MKALVFQEKGQPLQYRDFELPQAGEGEVLVQLKAAALNHRDLYVTQGQYPGIRTPIILGSDGAGLYEEREVVIQPGTGWGDHPAFAAKTYTILGLPQNGTFAEWVAVAAHQLYDKPSHLNWEQAAALPLAGLTAYRALFTKGVLQPGQRVLITGIGGGVALMGLQFAIAAGAQVWVTSSSAEKIEKAISLGASGGANYSASDWSEQLLKQAGNFDLIIDSAGGAGFANLVKLAGYGGRIVVYGGTLGAATFSPQILFWRQISILGTSMGTDTEFYDMLSFVNQNKIVPIIDAIYPLSAGNEAFAKMEEGAQFGKIVFQIKAML